MDALCCAAIGRQQMADNIRRKYCNQSTGNWHDTCICIGVTPGGLGGRGMASHLLSPESRRGQVFSARLFNIAIALAYLGTV